MTKRSVALVLGLIAGTACYHGRVVESLTTPTQPNGAQVILNLNSGDFSGELLSVEETGLLLLSGSRVVLVPFEAIRSGRFPEFARAMSIGAGRPDGEIIRRVRLLSHFPGGISPLIRGKLLSMYHQTDWAAVR